MLDYLVSFEIPHSVPNNKVKELLLDLISRYKVVFISQNNRSGYIIIPEYDGAGKDIDEQLEDYNDNNTHWYSKDKKKIKVLQFDYRPSQAATQLYDDLEKGNILNIRGSKKDEATTILKDILPDKDWDKFNLKSISDKKFVMGEFEKEEEKEEDEEIKSESEHMSKSESNTSSSKYMSKSESNDNTPPEDDGARMRLEALKKNNRLNAFKEEHNLKSNFTMKLYDKYVNHPEDIPETYKKKARGRKKRSDEDNESIKNEPVKNESMKNEPVKNESIKNEPVKNESIESPKSIEDAIKALRASINKELDKAKQKELIDELNKKIKERDEQIKSLAQEVKDGKLKLENVYKGWRNKVKTLISEVKEEVKEKKEKIKKVVVKKIEDEFDKLDMSLNDKMDKLMNETINDLFG